MGSKVVRMMLLCFAEAHLQDVLLFEDRFDCYKGEVLLVSVYKEERKRKESYIYLKKGWGPL